MRESVLKNGSERETLLQRQMGLQNGRAYEKFCCLLDSSGKEGPRLTSHSSVVMRRKSALRMRL